jgi:hypothetical protein
VVLMQFDGGLSATLTMQGASHVEGRTLRIDGMRATLLGNESRNELEVRDHRTDVVEVLRPDRPEGGHSGGDSGLMRDFVRTLQSGSSGRVLTSAADSLVSHMLAFAAEEARLNERVIDFDEFCARATD